MNTMSRTVAPRAKPAFPSAAAMLSALAHSLSAWALPDLSLEDRMNRLMRVVDEQQKPIRPRDRQIANLKAMGTAQRGRGMPDASPLDASEPDACAPDAACGAALAGQPGADGPPMPTPDAPDFVVGVRLPYTF